MDNEPQAENKYPLPTSWRIPFVLQGPIREIAKARGHKITTIMQLALEEYIERHYKKIKKDTASE